MQQNSFLAIRTLRGGQSDNDPPLSIADDMCQIAENVEFFYSTMGERRLGCIATTLPTAISGDTTMKAVSWMGRYLPTSDLGTAELWALAQTLNGSSNVLTRRSTTAWSTVTVDDPINTLNGYGHDLSAVSLHGKYFVAYDSTVDQLHVYDGGNLRKTGLAQPNVPVVATTGSGSYASTRYFRVRYVKLSGATILLRSEPSSSVTFVPPGTGSGALITKPAPIGQGETHWELEASTDNANFYRIATTLVSTTTYTDTTSFATGYTSGTLSESLTSYTLLPSGKFVGVDSDRLLIAGSWENPAYASRLWWTPTAGNTGVGNDERLDMTVNPFIDLDGYEGGEITGLSRSINGYFYIFKWSHIYKVIRTGQRSNAYTAIALTKARGALPGSLVEAVDREGNPAQYFLDPRIGPMRIGNNGIEWCGSGVRGTWSRLNVDATVPVFGIFYEAKNQVHFWIAVDGADHPNLKLVLHCDELTSTGLKGATRGWTTVPVGDRIADAHCAVMFDANVDDVALRTHTLVPFIGKESWVVGSTEIRELIQRCDINATDCFTPGDDDAYYYARLKTKPFTLAGITNKFGMMNGAIALSITEGSPNNVYLRATRDFNLEKSPLYGVVMTDTDSQSFAVKPLDAFLMSESYVLELEFGDLDETILPSASWRLHAFTAKIRAEQTS